VLDHLAGFYPPGDNESDDGGWIVEARLDRPDATMRINPWGVGFHADPVTRQVRLNAEDPVNLAISARKCVREVLVDFCEQQRYVMLHASAVVDSDRVIILVGDKGSGKTTLALKAVLEHGLRYLSNDHLIVYPTPGEDGRAPHTRLALTSLPTLIPVKIGTFLDLEAELPAPWDFEGLDLDAYRKLTREQRYGLDTRVLYTFGSLGQTNPTTVDLASADTGPNLMIVLVQYTDGEIGDPESVADPVAALLDHVRSDWMFDPMLNQRFLPRAERGPGEYAEDARRLVTALAERGTVLRWAHRGDPAALLNATTQPGDRR
jgi:hypothetical protein